MEVVIRMKINIFLNKSVEENAGVYFDKAKKAKKKIKGAEEALEKSLKKLEQEKKKKAKAEQNIPEEKQQRKREWYEKFRWFYSSEGFLVIGGKDATTNEIIIKKHTDENDVVFHTEAPGSPFFVIKTEGKVPKDTLKETAQAAASYSKAWKLGLSSSDVFYVEPSQVSKEAQSGEYIAKGAFMIRGKKTILRPKLELAIGITKDKQLIGGPVEAIKHNSENHIIIKQGRNKASDSAKKIRKALDYDDLDEIIRFLPAGGTDVKT